MTRSKWEWWEREGGGWWEGEEEGVVTDDNDVFLFGGDMCTGIS